MFSVNSQFVEADGETSLIHGYDEIDMFHACSYYPLQDFDKLKSLTEDTFGLESKNDVVGSLKNQKIEWLLGEPYDELVKTKVPYTYESCVKSNESITRSYTKPEPDTLLEVTLDVVIEKGQKYYVLDEIPPKDWKVLYSGDLVLDPDGHLKIVVVSGAKNATYAYILEVPHELGEYMFDGIYQMDGMEEKRSIGQAVCEEISSYKWNETVVTKTRETYVDLFDYGFKYLFSPVMRSQKVQWVRICSDINREWTANGYEISADIIPKYDGITYDKLNWWNSTWDYSKVITIENINATEILYANWTINISIDTTDSSRFQVDCDDIRIVYNDLVELDRNITDCNTTNTQIWFALQKDIAVSSNDTDYKVYYGNSEATVAPSSDWKTFLIPAWKEAYIPIAMFANYGDVMYLNDSSPQENNATELSSGNKQSVDCLFGKCVNFSASTATATSYVIPYDSSFDTGTGWFAISMWLKYEGAENNGQEMIIDWRGVSTGEKGGFLHINTQLKVGFAHDGSGSGACYVTSDTPITRDEWYHVVAMGDESNCKVYINGILNGTSSCDAQGDLFPASDNHIHVGGRYDGAWGGGYWDFRGKIENLIWFNTSLTDAEIAKLYHYPINPQTYLAEESTAPLPIPFVLTVYSPQNTTYATTNISLDVDANETIDTWWYDLNGGGNLTFSPNTSITAQEGSNELTVYANDSSGNIGSSSVSFSVDSIPPTVTVYSPQNTTYASTDIPLSVSADEVIDTWWYSLNAGGNTTFSPNTTITAQEGSNVLIVYANDSLGNIGSSSVSFSVDVPPTVTVYSPQNTTYTTTNISLDVSANEIIDTWWYSFGSPSDWWNSTWDYRKQITIENNNATDILYANWTANISIDSTNQSKFRSDCNDIRIVYDDMELDRYIIGCNTTDTRVWFQLQEDIAPSSNSSIYKVYYGNPDAAAGLHDKFKVFANVPSNLIENVVIADFFEDSDVMYINDSSPYENNGTEVNTGGKEKVSGLFGESINFSVKNNDEYSIPYSPTYDTGTDWFVISAWVYTETIGNYDYVIDARTGGLGVSLLLTFEGGFNFEASGSTEETLLVCQTPSFAQNGVWYHIIATANDTECAVYVDGKNLVNSSNVEQGDKFQNSDIHIGGSSYDSSAFDYKGRIDNFLFLNQTVTEADVDKMYWFTNGQATPQTYLGIEKSGVGSSIIFFSPNTSITGQQGSNSLTVYANDSLGNIGSSSVSFSVDSVPPTVTVYSPQNITYLTADVPLSVSADEVIDTWWYSLNAGGNTTFSPNTTITALEGSNSLTVYANDSLGNIGSSSVSFSVDSTPPTVTVYSPQNTTYSSTDIPLSVSADEPTDTWWYDLNSGGNITFSPNTSITAQEGSNSLTVYANDSLGNIGSSSVSFSVDSTPPSVTVYSPQNTTYSSTDIPLSVSADEPVDIWLYSLNAGGNLTFAPNTSITAIEGSNTLIVYANDTLGNSNSSEIVYFTVSTHLIPNITVESPEARLYSVFIIPLNASSDALMSSWWYSLNGSSNLSFTPNSTILNLSSSGDGEYAIAVYGNSTSGDEDSVAVDFVVDTSYPLIWVDFPLNGTAYNWESFYVYGRAENVHLDSVWAEDSGWGMNLGTPDDWNFTYNGTIPENDYAVTFSVNDSTGRVSSATVRFQIDRTPPVVIVYSPADGLAYDEDAEIPFEVSSDDAMSQWNYTVDGGANATFLPNTTIVFGTAGNYTLVLYGYDDAMNLGSASVTFLILPVFVTVMFPSLQEAGSGIAGFLGAIAEPVPTFILGLGVVAVIVGLITSLAFMFRGVIGGAVKGMRGR